MKKCAIPILLLLHLLYPVCEGIAVVLRMEFSLFSDWGYFLILTAVTIPLTWAAAPSRWSAVLFPVTVIDGLCAIWGTHCLPAAVCAVIWCVCGGYLFHRSMKKGVKKMLVLALTAPLIIPMALSCPLDLFGEVMRSVTVIREVDSPDGTFTAQIIDADYGATGGDTLVKVRDNSSTLNLLFGSFSPEDELGYRGEWGQWDTLAVSWYDDHTLTIDGKTRIVCGGSGLVRSIYLGTIAGVTVNGEAREDPQWIAALYAALGSSKATRMSTVQDYPNEEVLYEIEFGSTPLFLYQRNGIWYIEQPYQGIWEADASLLELLA